MTKKIKLIRGTMEFERVKPRVWRVIVQRGDLRFDLPVMDHVLKFMLRDHRGRIEVAR